MYIKAYINNSIDSSRCFSTVMAKTEYRNEDPLPFCYECHSRITDKFVYTVNENYYHPKCLKCSMCQQNLAKYKSCYFKNENLFCQKDYLVLFDFKCSKCLQPIHSKDWIRKAKTNVYHLACFACSCCERQLSTGEKFILVNDKVYCRIHCEYQDDLLLDDESSYDGASKWMRNKMKRIRTTFTEEQLQVLRSNFELDCNPDGNVLEKISQITGLSKRVTQVWFQNSRARQKKFIFCQDQCSENFLIKNHIHMKEEESEEDSYFSLS